MPWVPPEMEYSPDIKDKHEIPQSSSLLHLARAGKANDLFELIQHPEIGVYYLVALPMGYPVSALGNLVPQTGLEE